MKRPGVALLIITISGCGVLTRPNEVDEKYDWWKYTTIYQIYLQSFKDSNVDGVGDVTGLRTKLQHLADIGVETIWFNPILESRTGNYDSEVSNYTNIGKQFGTIQEFEDLTKETKRLGIKVVMDFLVNNCGDQHPWFQNSVKGVEEYSDFFIWQDHKGFDNNGNAIPPNNWLSMSGGSAWAWNMERSQFYYHQYAWNQPDLNLRNPKVIDALKDVLRFWFSKGVDGIRINGGRSLFEDKHLRDEPYKWGKQWSDYFWDLDHIYTLDQPENYQLIREFKEFVDDVSRQDGCMRIVFSVPTWDITETMKYYGTDGSECTNFPLNYELLQIPPLPTANHFDERITNWMKNMPKGMVPNWVSGNQDTKRRSSHLGNGYEDIYIIMVSMLPGVAVVYYGQEIGMEDIMPGNDDPPETYRSPMQWDDTVQAGFSTAYKTWISVNPNYWRINVKTEKADPNSHYYVFKRLMEVRKSATARQGALRTYVLSKWTYAFTRTLMDHDTYVVVFNFGNENEVIELSANIPQLNNRMQVLVSSSNSGHSIGKILSTSTGGDSKNLFVMRPHSAVVLTSDISQKLTTSPPTTTEEQTLPPTTTYISDTTGKSFNNANSFSIVAVAVAYLYAFLQFILFTASY